jgi:hypothetical protein
MLEADEMERARQGEIIIQPRPASHKAAIRKIRGPKKSADATWGDADTTTAANGPGGDTVWHNKPASLSAWHVQETDDTDAPPAVEVASCEESDLEMIQLGKAETDVIEAERALNACKIKLETAKNMAVMSPWANRAFVLHLVCDILRTKGPLPVGEVGKRLQEATQKLPGKLAPVLKHEYGGLKKVRHHICVSCFTRRCTLLEMSLMSFQCL